MNEAIRRGDFSFIPVIDISALGSDCPVGERTACVAALGDALQRSGFVYLAGHGVSDASIERVRALSRRFHALPLEAKMRIEMNDAHRGYMPFATSTIVTSRVAKVTRPNLSESFMAMHDRAPRDPKLLAGEPLQGPNQWPAEVPELRAVVLDYMTVMSSVGRRIAEALAEALGLPRGWFLPHFDDPTLFLRLLHYPQQPDEPELYGSAPHTDYGFVTILAQDDVGGLEVRNRQGEWIPAPPMPRTFVMNVGDILERWSNGRFASTPHRVRNLTGRERYSQPFFYDPSMDSVIACPDAILTAGEAAKYPPVRYGDYLIERLNKNYQYRKTAG